MYLYNLLNVDQYKRGFERTFFYMQLFGNLKHVVDKAHANHNGYHNLEDRKENIWYLKATYEKRAWINGQYHDENIQCPPVTFLHPLPTIHVPVVPFKEKFQRYGFINLYNSQVEVR